VKISELKVGYKVISYDEIKNRFVENTIDRVIVHDGIQSPRHDFDQYPLLDVTINTNGIEKRTKVTANHLYFSPDKKEYQYIGEFSIGDKVTSIDGIGYVVSKKPISLAPTVYNLHMKNQPNNYLVNGVVVHNEKAEACTGCVGASCSVF
jgi:intein/homing endonuclease